MEAQLRSYHTAVSFNTSCSDFTSFYFSPPCSPGLVTAPIQRSKKGQAEDILQSMGAENKPSEDKGARQRADLAARQMGPEVWMSRLKAFEFRIFKNSRKQ